MITKVHIRNFLYLSIAEGISNVIFLGVVIYLARVAGSEGLGQVTFARSIIQYLLLLMNAGLELYAIREGSRNPAHIPRLINTFMSLRLILVLIGFGFLSVLLVFLPMSAGAKQVLMLYGGMLLTTGFLLEWPFQAVEKMHFSAIGRVVAEVVSLGVVVLFVRQSNDVFWVPIGRFAGTGLQLALLFVISLRFFGKIRLEWQPAKWKGVLKESLPMAAGFIMVQVYSYTDNIMLGFIRSEKEVGLYSAAYKIVMAVVLIGVVYHKVIYPALSRLFHDSREKMDALLIQSAKLMVIGGLPVVAGFWIFAANLIRLLYGQGFEASVPIFQILILKVPFMWINGLIANAVLASNEERRYLISVSIGALANVILNAVFIPLWGMQGAAIATILSECAVFVYFFVVYLIKIKISLRRDIRGLLAAVLVSGLVYAGIDTLIAQKFVPFLFLCFFYVLILCIFNVLDFKRIIVIARGR